MKLENLERANEIAREIEDINERFETLDSIFLGDCGLLVAGFASRTYVAIPHAIQGFVLTTIKEAYTAELRDLEAELAGL